MMITIGPLARVLLAAMLLAIAPALMLAQTPTPAQEGFVPVEQLEGQEELPAAPLVAAAYAVAWAAVLVYLFSIWKRLGAVEREMADVARRIQPGERR
jgi:CcmD family protein